tara:strand:+ start:558 stop:734 length:177 start_codon:yes stop_codon:yes gene_type:complete
VVQNIDQHETQIEEKRGKFQEEATEKKAKSTLEKSAKVQYPFSNKKAFGYDTSWEKRN